MIDLIGFRQVNDLFRREAGDRILRLMAEKKASDVYLSAHAPALIKINVGNGWAALIARAALAQGQKEGT